MNNFERSRLISSGLLQMRTITYNFKEPFIWASSWKLPMYCDNRIPLSDPFVFIHEKTQANVLGTVVIFSYDFSKIIKTTVKCIRFLHFQCFRMSH